MNASEPAQLLLQADIPWTISFFILGPISVISAFIFYQLIVPGLLKWRHLKDDMTVALTQYANYLVFVVEKNGKKEFANDALYERVNQDLRRLAGEVTTLRHVFLYRLWVKFHWLPNTKMIDDIQGDLIGWSNSLIEKPSGEFGREIRIESLKMNLGMKNRFDSLKKIQELEWKNARGR